MDINASADCFNLVDFVREGTGAKMPAQGHGGSKISLESGTHRIKWLLDQVVADGGRRQRKYQRLSEIGREREGQLLPDVEAIGKNPQPYEQWMIQNFAERPDWMLNDIVNDEGYSENTQVVRLGSRDAGNAAEQDDNSQ